MARAQKHRLPHVSSELLAGARTGGSELRFWALILVAAFRHGRTHVATVSGSRAASRAAARPRLRDPNPLCKSPCPSCSFERLDPGHGLAQPDQGHWSTGWSSPPPSDIGPPPVRPVCCRLPTRHSPRVLSPLRPDTVSYSSRCSFRLQAYRVHAPPGEVGLSVLPPGDFPGFRFLFPFWFPKRTAGPHGPYPEGRQPVFTAHGKAAVRPSLVRVIDMTVRGLPPADLTGTSYEGSKDEQMGYQDKSPRTFHKGEYDD